MTATATVRNVYRTLLKSPGDRATMLVFADALEEAGKLELAEAYRWAAEREKWPFVRHEWRRFGRDETGCRRVYDWNRLMGDQTGHYRPVPESAQLPRGLIRGIVQIKERRYGGVHRAFVLLGNALKTLEQKTWVGNSDGTYSHSPGFDIAPVVVKQEEPRS